MTVATEARPPFVRPAHTLPTHRAAWRTTLVATRFDGRSYRTTHDLARLAGHDVTGLAAMRAIGCEQFSETALRAILAASPGRRHLVVDLRQECHGFIDGADVCWVSLDNNNWSNAGKSPAEILATEQKKLGKLVARTSGKLVIPAYKSYKDQPFAPPLVIEDIATARVETEADLCLRLGVAYHRFPVTDHARCSDAELDNLLVVLRHVATLTDTTIIFHCQGGKGRTNMVMLLYDMLLNAQHVACAAIIERQLALRPPKPNGPPKMKTQVLLDMTRERLALLDEFYLYARQHPVGKRGAVGWCEWLDEQEDASEDL